MSFEFIDGITMTQIGLVHSIRLGKGSTSLQYTYSLAVHCAGAYHSDDAFEASYE